MGIRTLMTDISPMRRLAEVASISTSEYARFYSLGKRGAQWVAERDDRPQDTARPELIKHSYPRQHSDGDFTDSGKINTVNGAKVSLKELPAGLQLSAGDYLSLEVQGRRVLHQALEAVTADEDGETEEFEVRPAPWPGTAADIAVSLKKPSCRMALLPQSITTKTAGLHTTISFNRYDRRRRPRRRPQGRAALAARQSRPR